MYNRYIPTGNTYTRITEGALEPPAVLPASLPERPAPPRTQRPRQPQQVPQPQQPPPAHQPPPSPPRRPSPPSPGGGSPLAGLTGLLSALRPEELDSGDILLLLILLFLFRDGDDIELLITLGLILLLGPEEKPDKAP